MTRNGPSQFRIPPQLGFNFSELVVDNFAGGGGASTGIERALGRPVDIAINHDPAAIEMHKVNHPHTRHYCESVWDVDPVEVCGGQPVGLVHSSPDCKHFSKAKGGALVDKNVRGLAWVKTKWAGKVKPRIMTLENVEEFKTWGPLIAKRCKETGRIFKADKTVAAPGERVPVQDQWLVPDPKRKGRTFRRWVQHLEGLGYKVEYREWRASDYGAPTSRKRLLLVARCDGAPIIWSDPTHGEGRKPHRTAADIIDWSIPVQSIFDRKKPLADNTLRRIARGIQRFVIDHPDPFIIRIGQTGFGGDRLQYSIDQPLTTITTKAEHCLVTPLIAKHFGGATGSSIEDPLPTITTRNTQNQLVTASLIRHFSKSVGSHIEEPVGSITAGGSGHTGLVTSHLVKLRGSCKDGQDVRRPLPTITAGGQHIGEVRAFLLKYYGTAIGQSCSDPLHSVTSKARFGLVTVKGVDYQIVDIGMRMLSARELFLAQGFGPDYIIDRDSKGNRITKTSAIARCGNSVPPIFTETLVRANMLGTYAAQASQVAV